MEDSHYHDDLLKIDFLKSLKEKFKESGNYLLTQNEIVWLMGNSKLTQYPLKSRTNHIWDNIYLSVMTTILFFVIFNVFAGDILRHYISVNILEVILMVLYFPAFGMSRCYTPKVSTSDESLKKKLFYFSKQHIINIQKAVDFEESVLMAPYLDVQLLEKTQSLHQKKAELAKTQKQLEEEQDNFAQMKKELEQEEKNLTSLMETNIPNPFQIPQSSKRKISS